MCKQRQAATLDEHEFVEWNRRIVDDAAQMTHPKIIERNSEKAAMLKVGATEEEGGNTGFH